MPSEHFPVAVDYRNSIASEPKGIFGRRIVDAKCGNRVPRFFASRFVEDNEFTRIQTMGGQTPDVASPLIDRCCVQIGDVAREPLSARAIERYEPLMECVAIIEPLLYRIDRQPLGATEPRGGAYFVYFTARLTVF